MKDQVKVAVETPATTRELKRMKEKFEQYVFAIEMKRQIQPFTVENFKEWIQDLEEITENGYSYEDGYKDGKEAVKDSFRDKLRDISTDLDNLKEKVNDLEQDCEDE